MGLLKKKNAWKKKRKRTQRQKNVDNKLWIPLEKTKKRLLTVRTQKVKNKNGYNS